MSAEAHPRVKRVRIVGAGFSSLVAAWALNREGYAVEVYEKQSRAGGLIGTQSLEHGLAETAANGLLASALVEELAADCGLVLQRPKRSARKRYLVIDDEPTRWPLTVLETIRVVKRLFSIRYHAPKEGEYLHNWAERALGRAMAEKVVSVAVLGIFAAPAKALSASLVVGRFFDRTRPRARRGRLRGTVSFAGGMGSLIDALHARLTQRGVKFHFGFETTSDWVRSNGHEGIATVIATSAWAAAPLLSSDDPRQSVLQKVTAIPVSLVTLFFKNRPRRRGFGFLFDQSRRADGVLGCLQNSEIFAGRANGDLHAESWIVQTPYEFDVTPQVLEKRAKVLGETEQPIAQRMVHWKKAIPLYDTELEKGRLTLLDDQRGVVLFGNYLGEIGLASILELTRSLSRRIETALKENAMREES